MYPSHVLLRPRLPLRNKRTRFLFILVSVTSYANSGSYARFFGKTYYGWAETFRMIRELQPNAVIWNDGGDRGDLRRVGTEAGNVGETNWSLMPGKGDTSWHMLHYGVEDGDLKDALVVCTSSMALPSRSSLTGTLNRPSPRFVTCHRRTLARALLHTIPSGLQPTGLIG